jgi:hypothetical protein
VRRLIEDCCDQHGINPERGHAFQKALCGEWQLLADHVDIAAERVWSSQQRLEHSDGSGTSIEFFSLCSETLREDCVK